MAILPNKHQVTVQKSTEKIPYDLCNILLLYQFLFCTIMHNVGLSVLGKSFCCRQIVTQKLSELECVLCGSVRVSRDESFPKYPKFQSAILRF